MKLPIVAGLLVSSASAFTPPSMTFAVGKKKASATKAVSKKAPMGGATKPVAKKEAKKFVNPFTMGSSKPEAKAAVSKPVAMAKPSNPFTMGMGKPEAKATKPVAMAKPMSKPMSKPVAKAAPKPAPKPAAVASSSVGTIQSIAIPYEKAPATLDGSIIGDVGFDPCFLSTKADGQAQYFNGIVGGADIDGLTWYREAELMHGRICMLAVVGFIAPGFGTFDGNDWTGVDAFSASNPLEAWGSVPSASLFQIFAFMAALEFRRINIIAQDGSSYMAGDSQKWGQGEGRWNPLGLNYTPEQYAEKQLQETKHGRLAMIALLGLIFQANASGVNVVQQWSAALTTPDYAAKAGYFLPEGI